MTDWRIYSLFLVCSMIGCARGTPEEQLAAVDDQYQGVVDRYQQAYDAAETEEAAN